MSAFQEDFEPETFEIFKTFYSMCAAPFVTGPDEAD